jgi:hypothetical protein
MYAIESLTEEQRAVLNELIESELNGLPVEIRHTDNSGMRESLHQRMKIVQELFNRFHEPVAI